MVAYKYTRGIVCMCMYCTINVVFVAGLLAMAFILYVQICLENSIGLWCEVHLSIEVISVWDAI